ncbi:MAG: hypothetical protein AB7L66_15605 [Gemmatimonadales bacterium]
MSFFRRHFGLDAIDLLVHAVVTGMIMGFVGSNSYGRFGESLLFLIAGSSVVLFAVRRRLALRKGVGEVPGLTTGQMAAERLEELEARVAQLEAAEARVVELEERLDFTERLLAQSTGERASLPAGERR